MRLSVRILSALLLVASTAACAGPLPAADVRVVGADAVQFPAVVQTAGFESGGDIHGYHLVVWDEGGAAGGALFRARVSDVQVLDALESLGAEPGNALDIDTWDQRHEPGAAAPERVIQGPPVRIEVLLPDGRSLRLDDILRDPGDRGFDMRFGGHRANIPEWHSGCVACLYSCPGSKVGNASYTVRDFVAGTTRFEVRSEVLPADGTEVTIRMTLEESAP